jgi:periplasmic divalent cation tolerance protein
MAEELVVLITASSPDEAQMIGTALVAEHLAACVNIVPQVRSVFFWQGGTQDEGETLLIAKSRQPLLEKLISRVKALHSYSVPEVIALPVVGGSREYLEWLNDATKSSS